MHRQALLDQVLKKVRKEKAMQIRKEEKSRNKARQVSRFRTVCVSTDSM